MRPTHKTDLNVLEALGRLAALLEECLIGRRDGRLDISTALHILERIDHLANARRVPGQLGNLLVRVHHSTKGIGTALQQATIGHKAYVSRDDEIRQKQTE